MAYYNFNYPPELNPFLDDDDSLSSAGSYNTAELPQPNFAPPPLPPISNFKLQAFWPDAPVAWFRAAEAQFTLWRVMSQVERFCHVTAALDKHSLKKIVHLVVTPDPTFPYDSLKDALLASHQLTDFQWVELLLTMELLGACKPSELLADVWEIVRMNHYFFDVNRHKTSLAIIYMCLEVYCYECIC